MLSHVKNFVLEQLYRPLLPGTEPYNMYNTVLYAAIFAGLTVYILLPAIRNLEIEKDKMFYLSFTPWIFIAGVLSALHEAQILHTALASPPVLALGLALLLTASLTVVEKLPGGLEIDPKQIISFIGVVFLLPLLGLFSFDNLEALLPSVILTLSWLVLGLLLLKFFRPEYLSLGFVAPVATHYLDATSTVVALSYGAVEQQLVAARFIEILGPSGIFILKTIVIIPAVLIIDREIEDEDSRLFYLFVIAALGLGISVRNLVLLFSGF